MQTFNLKYEDYIEEPGCANCKMAIIPHTIILDNRQGYYVCDGCGIVIEETYIDPSGGARYSSDTEPRNSKESFQRVYERKEGSDLGTAIGAGNKQLNFANKTVQGKEAKSLSEGYNLLDQFSHKLKIPQRELIRAKELYSLFESKRSRSVRTKLKPFICAFLYIACESLKLTDIGAAADVPVKDIRKAYKSLSNENADFKKTVKTGGLIPRICSKLTWKNPKLKFKIQFTATEFEKKAKEKLAGRKPASIAAVCVWIVIEKYALSNGETIEKKDVASAATVSVVTINNLLNILDYATQQHIFNQLND